MGVCGWECKYNVGLISVRNVKSVSMFELVIKKKRDSLTIKKTENREKHKTPQREWTDIAVWRDTYNGMRVKL